MPRKKATRADLVKTGTQETVSTDDIIAPVPTLEEVKNAIKNIKDRAPVTSETRDTALVALYFLEYDLMGWLDDKGAGRRENMFNWTIAAMTRKLVDDGHAKNFKTAFVALAPNLDYEKDGPIYKCFQKLGRDEWPTGIPQDANLVNAVIEKLKSKKRKQI